MAQTIKLKRSATASAIPSTAQLALGEIAINTFDGKLYIKKDNGTESVIEVGADGASSEGATVVTISQASHGFSLLECIRYNGSSWVLAQADNAATLALGVIVEVVNTNTFKYAMSGRFNVSNALTPGEWYYLSSSVAGELTSIDQGISQPLLYAESTTHISVYPYRPSAVLEEAAAGGLTAEEAIAYAIALA